MKPDSQGHTDTAAGSYHKAALGLGEFLLGATQRDSILPRLLVTTFKIHLLILPTKIMTER